MLKLNGYQHKIFCRPYFEMYYEFKAYANANQIFLKKSFQEIVAEDHPMNSALVNGTTSGTGTPGGRFWHAKPANRSRLADLVGDASAPSRLSCLLGSLTTRRGTERRAAPEKRGFC